MVWEENAGQLTNVLYQVGDGLEVEKGNLTPKGRNAYLPVVTQTLEGFVVAFLMESENGVGVYTVRL